MRQSGEQIENERSNMKKLVLLAGTVLILAGCNQGGTEDKYGAEGGKADSQTNSVTTPGSTNMGTEAAPGAGTP
jgi:hypothetical protein